MASDTEHKDEINEVTDDQDKNRVDFSVGKEEKKYIKGKTLMQIIPTEEFMEKNKGKIYTQILRQVEKSLDKDYKKVDDGVFAIFIVAGTDILIKGTVEECILALKDAMVYFIETENYEKCSRITRILEEIE